MDVYDKLVPRFFQAVLAVSIGVPVLLCYVYAVVPIALCRSGIDLRQILFRNPPHVTYLGYSRHKFLILKLDTCINEKHFADLNKG